MPGIGPESSAIDSEAELIKSTSVALRVIDKLGLEDWFTEKQSVILPIWMD